MFGTIVTIGLCLYGIMCVILISVFSNKRSDYVKLIEAYYKIVNAINEYDLTDKQKEKLEKSLFEITCVLNDLEREGNYFDY